MELTNLPVIDCIGFVFTDKPNEIDIFLILSSDDYVWKHQEEVFASSFILKGDTHSVIYTLIEGGCIVQSTYDHSQLAAVVKVSYTRMLDITQVYNRVLKIKRLPFLQ